MNMVFVGTEGALPELKPEARVTIKIADVGGVNASSLSSTKNVLFHATKLNIFASIRKDKLIQIIHIIIKMKSHFLKLVALITLLTAGGFACTKDDEPDKNMVAVQIKNMDDKVDPYIVSFALPGIVDIRCWDGMPYRNTGAFPGELYPDNWFINLVMAKGTKRTKLAPIITLAPGCTIMPKSGTVLDFSKNIEWTLQTPDGSTVKYYLGSVFVIDDTDEANMVPTIIRCSWSNVVDTNIVSLALPGIFTASAVELLPYPDEGVVPEGWSSHCWTIGLGMAKGTDPTKLAPIITLAPGAKITWIHHFIGPGSYVLSKKVDYSGTFKMDAYDFTKQVSFFLIAPDGSTLTYTLLVNVVDYY